MDFSADIAKVKELLDKSPDIVIATHASPNGDSIGSSLSLYLGLVSLGKRVTIVCPDPMTVGLSSFVGVDKFKVELGKKNFVISLDYVDGSIEKVSYNIEGNKFNLVIEPRSGLELFTEDKVHFSNAGANVGLIFTVGTINLLGLRKFYEDEKELFATKPVVNIDHHTNNTHYGQVNLVGQGASSTAEITAYLLSGLGVRLTPDIATNLVNALYQATNNFTSASLSPSAFEVAAVCLKAGGKRFSVTTTSEELPGGGEAAFSAPPTVIRSNKPRISTNRSMPVPAKTQPAPPTQASQSSESGLTAPLSQAPSASFDKTQDKSSGQAPADWLKPKIFKSSNSNGRGSSL